MAEYVSRQTLRFASYIAILNSAQNINIFKIEGFISRDCLIRYLSFPESLRGELLKKSALETGYNQGSDAVINAFISLNENIIGGRISTLLSPEANVNTPVEGAVKGLVDGFLEIQSR